MSSTDEKETTTLEDCAAVAAELNDVVRDLQAKQQQSAAAHRQPAPVDSAGVDEQTKVQLAKEASRATVPGAVSEQPSSNDRHKPSNDQLEEVGNLLRIHKNRQVQQNREDHLPSELVRRADEEQPLDEFQGRMNDFRIEENQRTQTEDKELRERKKRRTKWLLVVLVVGTIIIGSGIGVAVGLGKGAEDGDGVVARAFENCYMRNDPRPSDRFLQLRSVVLSAWDSSGLHPADSVGSSHRAALCWLSNVDTFELSFVNETNYEVVQRFALASIYYHFVGAASDRGSHELPGSNWLDRVHVCGWDFVVCDGPDNKVTELFLDGLSLYKSIPEELALMSDLVYLRLISSHLTGTILSVLSLLTQLKVLDLDFNKFSGTIPSGLGSPTELRTLQLEGNTIGGEIPSELLEIPKLQGSRPTI